MLPHVAHGSRRRRAGGDDLADPQAEGESARRVPEQPVPGSAPPWLDAIPSRRNRRDYDGDGATAPLPVLRTARLPAQQKESDMDGAFLSHVIAWAIGGMTALGAVLITGALFSLGRRGAYRK